MAIPTRASTSKLLERTSRQLRGDYRRQSAETEEAQLNDFLQEVRQQTTLSTEAEQKPQQQQQKPQRRRKVHLGSDVSDVSVTSSSSGGARAAAASRFLKSKTTTTGAATLKQQQQPPAPQPQPSAAPPKRTSTQQQQQHAAPGRHSAVLDKVSRLTSQRPKQQQQQQQPAAVSTSLSSSLTDPDRPKSRKARLQPTPAEAREAEDETQHQLYRHRASLDYLTESDSRSIGQDGGRFLRRTTDATPQRPPPKEPSDDEAGGAAHRQPPLTPKSPKQLRFSTEHHVRSFTADSAEYEDSEDAEEDEETHSGQADRLVIRHRPPVPPIELSQDSSIGEVVVRKPALKKSSSFSDIQGADDAAGLLETSRQFESIDTDEPPTRRSGGTFAPVGESIEDAREPEASSSSSDSEAAGQNIILDFEQLSAAVGQDEDKDAEEEFEEDVDYDRSVAEEISTAEASDKYDSDFEAEAGPTYTQDFDDAGDTTGRRPDEDSEAQRRSSWDSNSVAEGDAASSSTTSRSTVREEIRTTARDKSSSSSIDRTESRTATNSSATTTATTRSSSSDARGRRGRRRSRRYRSRSPSPRSRRIRDAEVQTHPEGSSLSGGGFGSGLRYQWDAAGVGQAAASHGLGLGSVDPTPIASLTVSADALEAVTAYSPASVALNSLVRDQLALTAAFLASQRRVYQGALDALRREPGQHRYTTLEDTREFIERNRPKSLTMKEALRLLEVE